MAAQSKKARTVRQAGEFDVAALARAMRPPRLGAQLSWDLPAIIAARDDQSRGRFDRPAQMAAAMRTDDALYVAYETRLAPQRCIRVSLEAANETTRARSIAEEADALYGQKGVGVSPATMSDIHGCLVEHGIAVGIVTPQPREDGSRVDFYLNAWPIAAVYWDENKRALFTRVDGGPDEQIVHGDGRWVVFAKHELEPWRKEAAILPAALVWMIHAFGLKDWAKGSKAQGNAKAIATMREGDTLQAEDGSLSPDATAMIEMMRGLFEADNPIGVLPSGTSLNFLASGSATWQVFDRIVLSREKAAARIYLGTDGSLGSAGGAPGVDIETLFDVAATRVEGDLTCLERGFYEGVIVPWCAVNFGDSTLAPQRCYEIPDNDADAASDAEDKRRGQFFAAVERARATGFEITPLWVADLAASYAIDAPDLVQAAERAPQIALAPADIARVVSVNEARASAGLGPLMLSDGVTEDPAGRLTIERYAALANAPPPAPAVPAGAPQALRLVRAPGSPDAQEHAARMTIALLADIREAQQLGLTFTQKQIDEKAEAYGVPAPKLAGAK